MNEAEKKKRKGSGVSETVYFFEQRVCHAFFFGAYNLSFVYKNVSEKTVCGKRKIVIKINAKA